MKNRRITHAEAQRFLSEMTTLKLDEIEKTRYYEPDAASPEDWQNRYLGEKCRSMAAGLVSARGPAMYLMPEDLTDLEQEGFSKDDINRIREEINILKSEITSPEYRRESGILATSIPGYCEPDDHALRKIGSLRLRAEAEALKLSDRRKPEFFSLTLSADPVERHGPEAGSSHAFRQGKRYSSRVTSVLTDYIAGRNRGNADSAEKRKITADLGKRKAILTQFTEAVDIENLVDLRQEDLFHYISVLERLPRIYNKNPEDRSRNLMEILQRAEHLPSDKVGLSAATINRNITVLQGFLKFARSRGTNPREGLDLSILRKPCSEDERGARLAFSEEDMAKIARHPVWTGCRNSSRRNRPGEMIIRDGLFWGPVIASLTGARREEIIGMTVDEVDFSHKIPHFHIRKNRNRRLKNVTSERLVPMHRTLEQLGFRDYVANIRSRGETDLFPEFRPQGKTGGFGDVFYGKWKLIARGQLGPRAHRRTFHSFRHRFISILRHEPEIPKDLVQDLVGHRHRDETDDRYRKVTDFRDQVLEKLLPVVNRVPSDAWLNAIEPMDD